MVKPPYIFTGGNPKLEEEAVNKPIQVYTKKEIKGVRAACRLGRSILDLAGSLIKPGISTNEINKKCHDAIIAAGAYPSPLGYKGFPKSICTSVNNVICHGIPDETLLKDGDIINVDITVYLNGFHGDLSETFFVGTPDSDSLQLVQTAYNSLDAAIKECKPGMLYRDIGKIIAKHTQGYGIVKKFCGHGIGKLFHTRPLIPHYPRNKAMGIMKPGHIFTIEPMINQGTWRDKLLSDGWTAVTTDGKWSAQFEHTILITKNGHEILTHRTAKSYKYSWIKPKKRKNRRKKLT